MMRFGSVLLLVAAMAALPGRAGAQAPLPVYLHAATTTVGGSTYMTSSTAAPTGTAAAVAANIRTVGQRNLVLSGRSVFASPAAPTYTYWNIGGNWTFNVYTRATVNNTGEARLRVRIHRIAANGNLTTLVTSADSPVDGFATTSWVLNTITVAVPAGTVINPGERYGVQFRVNVTQATASATNGELRFDSATENSRFAPTIVVDAPPSDSFNRANGVLGVADSGHPWLGDGTSWGVCANAACTTGPAGEASFASVPTGLGAQRVTAVVNARSTTSLGHAAIIARHTPDWSTYLLYVGLAADGRVEVWTLFDGNWSATEVASANTAYNSSVARTLQARTSGNSLQVLVDGNSVINYLIPQGAHPLATKAGIMIETTDPTPANWARFDSFSVVPGP